MATLSNCFHVPVVAASSDDDNVLLHMNRLLTQSNMLQERLIEDYLMRRHVWQATDVNNSAESFPTLTLDDIRSLTLGIKLLQQKLMKYFLFFRCLSTKESTELHRRTQRYYQSHKSKC